MSSTKEPTILERVVTVVGGEGSEDDDKASPSNLSSDIVLLLLGCEANPPYGPYIHTATLFMDLICMALEQEFKTSTDNTTTIPNTTTSLKVNIKVYETSNGHFPNNIEYETCNGVILPGSFNSAYDEEPWIIQLSEVIQTQLVAKEVPTLGVCFGHQLYAHSFVDGNATKCLAGHQAGRRSSKLTNEGCKYLLGEYNQQQNDSGDEEDDEETNTEKNEDENHDDPFQLYYTHGDMVDKLPSGAVNLGGNNLVPIQSALYYARDDNDDDNDNEQQQQSDISQRRPIIAVTFQAHPEYGTSKELGLNRTLKEILSQMEKRGSLSSIERQQAEIDADEEFHNVQKKSIDTMVRVMKLLRWSPLPPPPPPPQPTSSTTS